MSRERDSSRCVHCHPPVTPPPFKPPARAFSLGPLPIHLPETQKPRARRWTTPNTRLQVGFLCVPRDFSVHTELSEAPLATSRYTPPATPGQEKHRPVPAGAMRRFGFRRCLSVRLSYSPLLPADPADSVDSTSLSVKDRECGYGRTWLRVVLADRMSVRSKARSASWARACSFTLTRVTLGFRFPSFFFTG